MQAVDPGITARSPLRPRRSQDQPLSHGDGVCIVLRSRALGCAGASSRAKNAAKASGRTANKARSNDALSVARSLRARHLRDNFMFSLHYGAPLTSLPEIQYCHHDRVLSRLCSSNSEKLLILIAPSGKRAITSSWPPIAST